MLYQTIDMSTRPPPGRQAFTLVELLAVVAILALLAGLLLPVVGRGLERGRTAACASNLRQYGAGALAHAADREGRHPGLARLAAGNGTVVWSELLEDGGYLNSIKRQDSDNREGDRLYCPTKRRQAQAFARSYVFNWEASGADLSDANVTGPLGQEFTPPPVHTPAYGYYRLGAAVGACPRPAVMFLILETERHADYAKYQSGLPASPPLGVDPAFPSWSSSLGFYAFRHDGRANFLFFDLHLETLSSTNEINTDRRLTMSL